MPVPPTVWPTDPFVEPAAAATAAASAAARSMSSMRMVATYSGGRGGRRIPIGSLDGSYLAFGSAGALILAGKRHSLSTGVEGNSSPDGFDLGRTNQLLLRGRRSSGHGGARSSTLPRLLTTRLELLELRHRGWQPARTLDVLLEDPRGYGAAAERGLDRPLDLFTHRRQVAFARRRAVALRDRLARDGTQARVIGRRRLGLRRRC
mmetsp:Transcript_5848/g.18307  ORF Transcript_5848/g.18307 Transcript_5848/m.18307 type:complete len:206 (-) Transcript_5848:1115-1732(-)